MLTHHALVLFKRHTGLTNGRRVKLFGRWYQIAGGRWFLVALGLSVSLADVSCVLAQADVSHPVVEAVSGTGLGVSPQRKLDSALLQLAKEPHSLDALAQAGDAALDMNNPGAAMGFYRRGLQLAPHDRRFEAGLAGGRVITGDPLDALPLFEAVTRTASIEPARLADYGLACDLVGDNQDAQLLYRQALSRNNDDETVRRLALSLAIAGDERGSATELAPLLAKQDRAAWRVRTFALAILGHESKAVATVRAIMPADLALAITPYLRYMPRLTRAQQAMAGDLGEFPQGPDIGVDRPDIVAWQDGHPAGTLVAENRIAVAAVPEASLRTRVSFLPNGNRSPVVHTIIAPSTSPPATGEPLHARASGQPAYAQTPAQTPVKTPVKTSVTQIGQRRYHPDFAKAFAAFDSERLDVAPTVSAVDVRSTIKQQDASSALSPSGKLAITNKAPLAIAAPEPNARMSVVAKSLVARTRSLTSTSSPGTSSPGTSSSAPSSVSRVWVQVGSGLSPAGLARRWRDLAAQDRALFQDVSPWRTRWGRVNRLMAGPFDSKKAAESWLNQLFLLGDIKDNFNGFVWVNPAGQMVEPLILGR